MYYICTKSEIGCTLDEKQMEMQTQNKKAEATREKDIYRVTVVGRVVNYLLLVFKFFAVFVFFCVFFLFFVFFVWGSFF